MEYIKELQENGFEAKMIVDFIMGASNERKLTLHERNYVVNYYRSLEISLSIRSCNDNHKRNDEIKRR